jgi:hypothetical protein
VFTIFCVSFFAAGLLWFDLMDSHHLWFLTLVHFDLGFGDLNLFDLLDNRWGLDSSLIFGRWLVSILAYNLLQLLQKLWVLLEHLSKLQSYSSVGWDVWSLIFESTMHIDTWVTDPDLMSSSSLGLELFPFWAFGLVSFQVDSLTDSVGSTSEDKHDSTDKDSSVLVSGQGLLTGWLVWSFNPIPSSISVSSKSPGVIRSDLILLSSTEDNHHTSGWTSCTQGGRVVGSWTWLVTWSL